jgi:hypothetical protein
MDSKGEMQINLMVIAVKLTALKSALSPEQLTVYNQTVEDLTEIWTRTYQKDLPPELVDEFHVLVRR